MPMWSLYQSWSGIVLANPYRQTSLIHRLYKAYMRKSLLILYNDWKGL